MQITIIYLENDVLISKENFESWRQTQELYADYKASLGAWDVEQVIEYLNQEYPDLKPSAEVQVSSLLNGSEEIRKLIFNQ